MTNDSIEIIDPNILLSIMNTKLRDQYASLDVLCYDLEIEKEGILRRLDSIGYTYNESENQFK
ncbi:hypothetical protein CLPUN_13850 [Clostridium puniceum]|uniref:DUF4250 domain-containing protein n=1 Tax=Clostridium puniceum TaxID=29367 RepID=A0A1S8TSC7_9CLOT|nr:DUF4250 domain-containing protein [Clostridium puniceum]OOM80275.1 hypothetical protein CLPUN_13850 [Clostridium puniceum]